MKSHHSGAERRRRSSGPIIFAFFSILVLMLLRLGGKGPILSQIPAPYSDVLLHTLGVALVAAITLFIDRLIRHFYWDGYLRRKRNQETPALIEDIVTVLLFVTGISIGLYFEAGMSFAGIITAGGATAIVVGIALQNVIQDLFGGLSINFDGSYGIGDWLTIYSDQFPDSKFGRVSGINWRTTFLRLEDGRRLMVPNRIVTANPVLNHSKPVGPKRVSIELVLDMRFPADRAMSILLGEAFKGVRQPKLLRSPEPSVLITKLGQDAANYEVRFYIDPEEIEPAVAQSLMTEHIHGALLRHRLPSPAAQVELTQPPSGLREYGEEEVRDALSGVELFQDALSDGQIAALGAHCKVMDFARGQTFIRQGETTASMFIILEGAARVSVALPDSQSTDVAVLGAGEVVGEMSLMTGAPRTATVSAITPLRALEITKPPIEGLLKASPELLERFGRVLARRQLELSKLGEDKEEEFEDDLLSQMRAFFGRVFG